MSWNLEYLPEVEKDLSQLSQDQRKLVLKAIKKVLTNPLPANEGGYGKPLGNKSGFDLVGLQKIKLRDAGLRVVYKVIRTKTKMLVIVVGARADESVYADASARKKKYGI